MVLNSNTLDFLWLRDGDQGAPGADGSSLYTWVKYSQAADGSHMTDNPTDAVYIGIAYNKTSAIESTNPQDYNWSLIKGDDGNDGQDAYTIILTNENISFSTDRTNLPLTNQSTTCNIIVYQGTTPITTFSIGTITAPTGIGVTKTTNSVTASVSNSVYVPNDNGMIQIPITIGNITVTKQIAYSLSKQGENGRGIASTVVEYQASNDGTRPPENDEWTIYIPSMRPSQFLWTRTRVTYTDGTTIYSFSVGKEGKGIATVTNEYKISISNTDPYSGRSDGTTSDWSAVRPNDLKTDEYLWIRYVYTYDDGSVSYSDEIYDSTIDGISSILDTENRTIKDTVWETAYMNVVDPDTGEVVRMNIKNTIVTSLTDITGIEQRVSTAEQNLGDFTNNEYTLFKQSVDSFKTEVTDNIANATTIAIQTAEDFSWLFSETVYDAYLIDDDGNYILDENGNYIKAKKDSIDDSSRISFTRNGMKMVNGIIEVKAPDGRTTIIEGGKINTNDIASIDGSSWINLGLGTFNYGDKLTWDGASLKVEGTVYATSGNIAEGVTIGDPYGYHAVMDLDSFDIFDADGTTKIATFGENTILGNTDNGYLLLNEDCLSYRGIINDASYYWRSDVNLYLGKTSAIAYDYMHDRDGGYITETPDESDYIGANLYLYKVCELANGKTVRRVIDITRDRDVEFYIVEQNEKRYLYVDTPLDVKYLLCDQYTTRVYNNRTYNYICEWDTITLEETGHDYYPYEMYPRNEFITYGSDLYSIGTYVEHFNGYRTIYDEDMYEVKREYGTFKVPEDGEWITEDSPSGESVFIDNYYYKLGEIPIDSDIYQCKTKMGQTKYTTRIVDDKIEIYVHTKNTCSCYYHKIVDTDSQNLCYCIGGNYNLEERPYRTANSISLANGRAVGGSSLALIGDALGDESVSIGRNVAYGGVAIGSGNLTYYDDSYAFGWGNTCDENSVAVGSYNYAGDRSVAIGHRLSVSGNYSTAIGVYNEDNIKYLFMIGNGGNVSHHDETHVWDELVRSNAFTVDRDGNVEASGNITSLANNHILWSGDPIFMQSGQEAELSEPVSKQLNGIVLVWSAYASNEAKNYDWFYQFVPKDHAISRATQGITTGLMTNTPGNYVGTKYVYVNDNSITGHANNSTSNVSNSGIVFNNSHWVLRYVLGV